MLVGAGKNQCFYIIKDLKCQNPEELVEILRFKHRASKGRDRERQTERRPGLEATPKTPMVEIPTVPSPESG
jgi:hypothetical protein